MATLYTNDIKEETDAELVVRAQAGDQNSLAELVRRYLSVVYNNAFRYMRNAADADDITQLVFIKMWRNLKRFDAEKSLKPWLGEIVKNTCLDAFKKKRAIPFSAFETEEGELMIEAVTASDSAAPDVEIIEKMDAEMLQIAAQKLTASARRVLDLYYKDGLNFREIGERLGESLHTVKSRHRRAVHQMRLILRNNK
ncbi:MAG: sigma-70 family RNA polymerase sigma factor [Candidatus Magasanikbacteria bacterium]|nr:sigma-70 family RNA polymerase sigma factor [Candidatus Magasanikbacteria bacterium]